MPTTRSPCPSTRATKQTTLLVPISRAAITPFLVFATMYPRALYANVSLDGPVERRVALYPFPQIELVRQSQIDDAELALKQFIRSLEFGHALQRRHRIF